MTLLTIAQEVAKNVGNPIPDQVIGSNDRTWKQFVALANATGEEISRRVDWSALTGQLFFNTSSGNANPHDMTSNVDRITKNVGATTHTGSVIRPVSLAEFRTLTATPGIPRVYLQQGRTISFWPYLDDVNHYAYVTVQSNEWCSGGSAWAADDNTTVLDEELFIKGLIVRVRRQRGMDYADYEAEYEAMLADLAMFDDGDRL